MKKLLLSIIALAIVSASFSISNAQRKVTPVEPESELKIMTAEEVKQIKERAKAEQHYADSIAEDSLKTDSIKEANKIKHPLLMSTSIGLNVWDPLMRAFGKNYGGGSIWAALNIRNKYIPAIELGLGMADDTPDDGNYTYKSKTAFFGKIGMNYNFMADKDPQYQLYAGARMGWSTFKYEITDITIPDGYWSDGQHIDILNQSSHALWGEVLLGLQVSIYRNFAIGWAIRYQFPFSVKDNVNSRPWYIPGYGIRDSKLNVNLSLIYDLPLRKDKKKKVNPAYDDNEESIPMPPPAKEAKSDSVIIPERTMVESDDSTKITN